MCEVTSNHARLEIQDQPQMKGVRTVSTSLHKLKSIAVLLLALAVFVPAAKAQTVKGIDSPEAGAGQQPAISGGAPSSFLIEPDAQIKGDKIKRQTYRSQSVGQNKNWDLDIGRFQAPINEDPNRLMEDLDDSNYSGMRLRLPLGGRAAQ